MYLVIFKKWVYQQVKEHAYLKGLPSDGWSESQKRMERNRHMEEVAFSGDLNNM